MTGASGSSTIAVHVPGLPLEDASRSSPISVPILEVSINLERSSGSSPILVPVVGIPRDVPGGSR